MKTAENKTPEFLGLLIQLNELQVSAELEGKETEDYMEQIGRQLPDTLFAHHKNITGTTAGRKSVAPLLGAICGNCCLSVPIADRFSVQALERIVLCHQCSVVLHPEDFKPTGVAETTA